MRGLGEDRPIEQLAGPELRAWILELRSTLSPISVAGYVRTLKVLGNWLAAEELAQAAALRTLRKPRVPDKLVEPISDDAMRRLLAVADVRDRAILLLLHDTGLRVSEAAGLRLGDASLGCAGRRRTETQAADRQRQGLARTRRQGTPRCPADRPPTTVEPRS